MDLERGSIFLGVILRYELDFVAVVILISKGSFCLANWSVRYRIRVVSFEPKLYKAVSVECYEEYSTRNGRE